MKLQKDTIEGELMNDRQEHDEILMSIEKMKERLTGINSYLSRAYKDKEHVERTIHEAEITKNKISEGMRTLLHSIQREDPIKTLKY